jgi:hypothetical protein
MLHKLNLRRIVGDGVSARTSQKQAAMLYAAEGGK